MLISFIFAKNDYYKMDMVTPTDNLSNNWYWMSHPRSMLCQIDCRSQENGFITPLYFDFLPICLSLTFFY